MNDITANILIVDDDAKSLFAIESLLSGPGRKIVTANSGAQALLELLREEFAVILLDVRMPEMDGFETAALIRQRQRLRHVPIIFLSGIDTLESDVLRGATRGAVDYLFKPVIPPVLQSKVAVFVDLYRMSEELRRQAVRQSEERFRLVIESLRDYAVYMLDPQGRVTMWNLAAERMRGWKAEEVLGQPCSMFFTPEECAAGQPEIILRRAGEEGWYEDEGWRSRKDGSRFWANTVCTRILADGGKLLGFSIVARDLTDRKRVEEQLRESERRHRELVEALPVAIYTTDASGTITHYNQAAVELWGQRPQPGAQWCGSQKILDPDGTPLTHDKCPMAIALKENRPVGGTEILVERPDGARVPVLPYPTPLHDERGALVGGVNMLVDITGRKRAENELKWFNTQLEQRVEERTAELKQTVAQREKLRQQLLHAQKMESVGTLASGVAHDFNNILNVIVSYAAIIERQPSEAVKLGESVQVIRETAQRGAELVQQLMALGRKAEIKPTPVNLNSIIEKLAGLIKETFPRVILTNFNLQPDLPPVRGEPNQLHQVFLNLCLNARDAIANGGRLTIQTEKVSGEDLRRRYQDAFEEQYVCASVSDTGKGMDEATVRRIFEPFFTTKPHGQGSGLGLSVVYGIVTSLGGFVDVESTPGKGTSLQIYLPVFASQPAPPGEPAAAPYFPKPAGNGETILFVDDEENQLRLMRWFFESEGYNMIAAKDGLEAVELYLKHKEEIAVVVLDLGLPKLGGWEALQQMREIQPDVKALIATGLLSPEVEAEMAQAKLGGVLMKPYQLDDVLAKVDAIIQARPTPTQSL